MTPTRCAKSSPSATTIVPVARSPKAKHQAKHLSLHAASQVVGCKRLTTPIFAVKYAGVGDVYDEATDTFLTPGAE